nr:hypothetical protein Iba_scaffold116CG0010 [Ipomoea batatas]
MRTEQSVVEDFSQVFKHGFYVSFVLLLIGWPITNLAGAVFAKVEGPSTVLQQAGVLGAVLPKWLKTWEMHSLPEFSRKVSKPGACTRHMDFAEVVFFGFFPALPVFWDFKARHGTRIICIESPSTRRSIVQAARITLFWIAICTAVNCSGRFLIGSLGFYMLSMFSGSPAPRRRYPPPKGRLNKRGPCFIIANSAAHGSRSVLAHHCLKSGRQACDGMIICCITHKVLAHGPMIYGPYVLDLNPLRLRVVFCVNGLCLDQLWLTGFRWP